MRSPNSVAIIGSFRKFYDEVLVAHSACKELGLLITSPKGTPILERGIAFVRFESDNADWNDTMVQTVALHRILRADFVYVVSPGGYVGRTTCYEIGRILQASRPIYFSEPPSDLPINISSDFVIPIDDLVVKIRSGEFSPTSLRWDPATQQGRLEYDLLNGSFHDDDGIV